jgi:hypothetical protein
LFSLFLSLSFSLSVYVLCSLVCVFKVKHLKHFSRAKSSFFLSHRSALKFFIFKVIINQRSEKKRERERANASLL